MANKIICYFEDGTNYEITYDTDLNSGNCYIHNHLSYFEHIISIENFLNKNDTFTLRNIFDNNLNKLCNKVSLYTDETLIDSLDTIEDEHSTVKITYAFQNRVNQTSISAEYRETISFEIQVHPVNGYAK